MKIGYLGNFEPEHSTENHVALALAHNGHEVLKYQENDHDAWVRCRSNIEHDDDLAFVLWTRTGWDPPIPKHLQREVLDAGKAHGTPIVGYHLDRWIGLNREPELRKSLFFQSDLVITADGDPEHQKVFESYGINHYWFPPGVSLKECRRKPRIRQQFAHDVVFCGSTESYHREWDYRIRLARWLEATFGDRIGIYPRNKPALRGQPLVDLYGSCKVIVGDSCLNGGIKNYWSDRIPETLGRGGFLIHPYVEGLEDHFDLGTHLVTYTLEDFDDLREKVEFYVEHNGERNAIAQAGKSHVMEHHTYERRMEQLVELLQSRYMI